MYTFKNLALQIFKQSKVFSMYFSLRCNFANLNGVSIQRHLGGHYSKLEDIRSIPLNAAHYGPQTFSKFDN